MRHAITTATRHGEAAPVVITDPSVPVHEQRAEFKALCRQPEHAEYSEVQLWTSDSGVISRRKFKEPKADDAAPKAKTDADKAAAKAKAAADKAAAKAKAAADKAAKAAGK